MPFQIPTPHANSLPRSRTDGDMLATGELQPLATQPDFLELAELLRGKVAGEPLPIFIHEVNAYPAVCEIHVNGRLQRQIGFAGPKY